jgi:hypothetical protein
LPALIEALSLLKSFQVAPKNGNCTSRPLTYPLGGPKSIVLLSSVTHFLGYQFRSRYFNGTSVLDLWRWTIDRRSPHLTSDTRINLPIGLSGLLLSADPNHWDGAPHLNQSSQLWLKNDIWNPQPEEKFGSLRIRIRFSVPPSIFLLDDAPA